jgi:hypothetical protein
VRIFWGTVGFIAAVIFALVFFHPFRPVHVVEEPKTTMDPASKQAILDAPIPDIAKEAIIGPEPVTASPVVETSNAKPLLEDDERLRGFDEL